MKQITDFQNKKVLILGLARSGQAAAKLLSKLGAIVTVNDGKAFEENPSAQVLLEEGIKVICGSHPLELLDEDFALIVKNPGIPYSNEMVKKALDKGIQVLTEVELAYLISEAPIFAITGSNGKTTTTTMIADVLNHAGQSALLSGNIGFPASEVAVDAKENDRLIMELSSFQLMGVDQFRPHIAVITNLMPTHIDYHGSFEEYVNAKWNIQNNMSDKDFLILNGDQEISYDLANKTKATILYFSSQKEVDGAYCLDGKLYFEGEYIMDADQIGVPGLHNVENALATIAVAKLANVDNDSIKKTLASFGGVKHRLQYVGQVNQIKFYNDSKSTNILACQKALSSFDNSNLILIAGGLDRGNEFDDLVPDIIGLKKLILLGQSADKMKKAAEKAGVSYLDAKDVAEATAIAFKEAKQGDVVLLSPANASWDMYKSFETRGDEFIQAFEQIKGDA
ncbi:UDP-N-acetylmuramoyl-L-alanine--D-glutamate ligase [Streptococcus parauberis]|uniref:UDP-N-acetylmuramoylalanine--D-glutamate ligase n=1 Tax=Streptococcus parauberis KRS-02083 TaxID=1207545 RepID=A0ABP2SYD7_9STRE|nr:UDP-N-acetylmuramoyl-L-alanine--D-glutamate ligase [Streptococcus parauberis]AUT06532.1 UDP-N-acetylmuramoyl-L-alanine--D-glutamate ligase [Streptococcus parauberis]EMG25458.1 UDP-N-acetylmuramoylalanine-D-glutamate ligase [Streptococcus parauberis KRS-02083]OHY29531.1 UDP-N-acetylmuramoyl-L-alanine--D-glutamate ligase [Streptococcus parauberis]PIA83159.1 UDP-N-acetylmuramoylalanine--D-glutamate ligase [Streptococcus parauberis]UWV09912.1 UDP-N-acetylmuramoyl-L-alanine--D-glutamate ligase [